MNRHHSYEEKLVELGMGRGSFFLARRAVFLLLDVCYNDSDVTRALAWT